MKPLILATLLTLSGCSSLQLQQPTIQARQAIHAALKAQVQETIKEADDWRQLLAKPAP